MSKILEKLTNKFRSKEYRDAFVESSIGANISHQLMLNRKARGLSQAELAELVGTKQSMISRYENPDYNSYSIGVLSRIASALDIGLSVNFQSYGSMLAEQEAWSPEKAVVKSYEEEVKFAISNGTSHPDAIVTSETPMAVDTGSVIDTGNVYVKTLGYV